MSAELGMEDPGLNYSDLLAKYLQAEQQLIAIYRDDLNDEAYLVTNKALLCSDDPDVQQAVMTSMESFKEKASTYTKRIIEAIQKVLNHLIDLLSIYSWKGRSLITLGQALQEKSEGIIDYKSALPVRVSHIIRRLNINGKMPSNLPEEIRLVAGKFEQILATIDGEPFVNFVNKIAKSEDTVKAIDEFRHDFTEELTNIVPVSSYSPRQMDLPEAGEDVNFRISRVMPGMTYVFAYLPGSVEAINQLRLGIHFNQPLHADDQEAVPLRVKDIQKIGEYVEEVGELLTSVASKKRELDNMSRALNSLIENKLTRLEVSALMGYPQAYQSLLSSSVMAFIPIANAAVEYASKSLAEHIKGEHPIK